MCLEYTVPVLTGTGTSSTFFCRSREGSQVVRPGYPQPRGSEEPPEHPQHRPEDWPQAYGGLQPEDPPVGGGDHFRQDSGGRREAGSRLRRYSLRQL